MKGAALATSDYLRVSILETAIGIELETALGTAVETVLETALELHYELH